jgi:hypothetical protein
MCRTVTHLPSKALPSSANDFRGSAETKRRTPTRRRMHLHTRMTDAVIALGSIVAAAAASAHDPQFWLRLVRLLLLRPIPHCRAGDRQLKCRRHLRRRANSCPPASPCHRFQQSSERNLARLYRDESPRCTLSGSVGGEAPALRPCRPRRPPSPPADPMLSLLKTARRVTRRRRTQFQRQEGTPELPKSEPPKSEPPKSPERPKLPERPKSEPPK